MDTGNSGFVPCCGVCGLPLYEISSTTGGICKGHPYNELDDVLKQFDIDALCDYWRATADRRLALLREVLDEVFPHPDNWCEIFGEELIDRLAKELSDE